MARVSSTIGDIKDHYTVVVVGSGYGGGIAASRMSRAGQEVCLLERGKEFQPGEYPNTLKSVLLETQTDLPTGHVGPLTGLYDSRVNSDIDVFLGCGLGGASLVNANVLGFGYNTDHEIRGIGTGNRSPEKMDPVGPCITGIIDLRDSDELDDGYVIEEGTVAGAMGTFLPLAMAIGATVFGRDTDRGFRDWIKERFRVFNSLIRGVLDNLNTHRIASLYKAFEPPEARRIARRLEIHYTPKHGS